MKHSEDNHDRKPRKAEKPGVRLGWGQVKPVTRVIPNKKKPKPDRKKKHKSSPEAED
jgi:hypothetical protein